MRQEVLTCIVREERVGPRASGIWSTSRKFTGVDASWRAVRAVRDRRLLGQGCADEPRAGAPRGVGSRGFVRAADRREGRSPRRSAVRGSEWPLARALASRESLLDDEFEVIAPDGSRRSFTQLRSRIRRGTDLWRGVWRGMSPNEIRRVGSLPTCPPLLDHTDDAIIAADAEWRVIAWNRGAERMYGWTAEEAMAQPRTSSDAATT